MLRAETFQKFIYLDFRYSHGIITDALRSEPAAGVCRPDGRRSVTRAAERLGITQPALSNALARLRTTMQDPLFVRERYGIQPTPTALELAPVIAQALASIDDAVLGQQEFDPAQAERQFTIRTERLRRVRADALRSWRGSATIAPASRCA